MNQTAVLVIDVQNDYFPGGRFPLWRATGALKRLQGLLAEARNLGLPLVFIRHQGAKGASFLEAGTPGADLHPGLGIQAGDLVLDKAHPDSFQATDLDRELKARGITRLVVAGMMTWMCVDTTVRSAYEKGYSCVLVEDCTASGWLSDRRGPILPWLTQRSFVAAMAAKFAKRATSRNWRTVVKGR